MSTAGFEADVQHDIESMVEAGVQQEKTTIADRYQRKVEILWRAMLEDEGMSEPEALEIVLRAVVKEAKERARESGRWSPQEFYGRADCLERAADTMLETVAEEMMYL